MNNIEIIVSIATVYFVVAVIAFYIRVVSVDVDITLQEIAASVIFWPILLPLYLILGSVIVVKRQIKYMKEFR